MKSPHDEIIDTWRDETSPDFSYYSRFETPDMIGRFWRDNSRFRKAFDKYLDLEDVLEIASGAGRHAVQIVSKCNRLTLIDTSEAATKIAKERFSKDHHVNVVLSTDGKTLPFERDRFSAVFSYDAMVHFEPLTIANYLGEISQILKPGGRAILHHSNYSKTPQNPFTKNPDWRNFMPVGFIEHISSRCGLDILEQQTFPWGKRNLFQYRTDALTIMERRR